MFVETIKDTIQKSGACKFKRKNKGKETNFI